MIRVTSVAPLDGYLLRVAFSDGTERIIDVEPYLRGPVFDLVRRDRSTFEAVRVDEVLGTIVWPTGADVAPEVLAGKAEPWWRENGSTRGIA